jgi:parallel beta-helix repeat protein
MSLALRPSSRHRALVSSSILLVLGLAAACSSSDLTDQGLSGDASSHPQFDTTQRFPGAGALVIWPHSVIVETRQNVHFAAYARSSRGDSVPVAVDWSASGGTMTTDGSFTSSATGTYSVVAKGRGRYKKTDSSTVIVVTPQPTIVRLSVSPTAASVVAGAKRTFVATGMLSDSSTVPVGVTWTATGGSVDASGTYAAGSAPGTYWLAAGNATTGLADTVPVIVSAPPTVPPTLRAVVLTPASASLQTGGTKAFTASGLMSDGSTTSIPIAYTATGGAVTSGGNYTAGSTPGSFRVVATDTSGTLGDTAAVTITAPAPTLSAIVLTPATASLQAGGTQQFSATGKMSDGSTVPVTVAYTGTGGTISGTGLYTAGQVGGAYRVIATAGANADTATVTVTVPAPPPPSTGCQGIAVAAGASIQSAVNANATGATFCLGAGTFARQSVAAKASQQFIGARDASGARLTILDGQGAVAYAFTGTATGVVIQGMIVQGYATPVNSGAAIWGQGATGWRIEDVEARNNAWAAIFISANSVIRGNYVHHNGWLGIVGDHVSGAVVDSNEIAYNNLAGNDPNFAAGGLKAIATSNLTLRGNFVHHNVGFGLWCDNCNATTYYLGNRVEDNTFSGIYQEVSADAVIDGNTVLRNGSSNRGGIWVDNSSNVEIRNNTVSGAPNGLILLRQISRPDLPSRSLTNAYVHDNTVTVGSGFVGLVQFVSDNSYFTGKGNRFDRNTYSSLPSTPFRWNNSALTLAQWNAAGQY